jgi:hypothetical protein
MSAAWISVFVYLAAVGVIVFGVLLVKACSEARRRRRIHRRIHRLQPPFNDPSTRRKPAQRIKRRLPTPFRDPSTHGAH